MQLSTNFQLHELTRSNEADRLEIDNTLDIEVAHQRRIITHLTRVCMRILEPVRVYYGKPIRPNSGYRCFGLEEAICARAMERFLRDNPNADTADYLRRKSHPTGQAVDFEIVGVPNIEIARWVQANLEFDQLILEFYSPSDPAAGWVHVSYKADGTNRNQVLTVSRSGTVSGLPK